MAPDTQIGKIEQFVDEMLNSHPDFFRVGIKIKPTNNIKIFIDGDKGVSIENCTRFNRFLYKKFEESGFYPAGDFSLEVSSPGVDEPLVMQRQYKKNTGRHVQVAFTDGSIKEGKLIEVTELDIIIEQVTGKGKKLAAQQLIIPFDNIKTTTVQIKF